MSEANLAREPMHTQGHSTAAVQTKESEYICPECGKKFNNKDDTEKHLHAEHLEHLRTVHGEAHGKDAGMQHET